MRMVKMRLDLLLDWPSLPSIIFIPKSFINVVCLWSCICAGRSGDSEQPWQMCSPHVWRQACYCFLTHPSIEWCFMFSPPSLSSVGQCVCWAQGLPSRPGHSPHSVSNSSGITQLLWDCRSGRINPLWEGTTVPLQLSPASHWPVRTRNTLQSHTLFTKGFASINAHTYQFGLIPFNFYLFLTVCCASYA